MFYPTLPGWSTGKCSNRKFLSHLGGIPAKSSEIPPKRPGSLLSYEHIMFLQEFLEKIEISPRWASPANRASSLPYEQLLKKFEIFTGKHLCWSPFLMKSMILISHFMKKRLQYRCFFGNIAKFFRTAFFIENFRWLLLFIIAFNSDKSNQFSVGGREFKSKGKKESLFGFHIWYFHLLNVVYFELICQI